MEVVAITTMTTAIITTGTAVKTISTAQGDQGAEVAVLEGMIDQDVTTIRLQREHNHTGSVWAIWCKISQLWDPVALPGTPAPTWERKMFSGGPIGLTLGRPRIGEGAVVEVETTAQGDQGAEVVVREEKTDQDVTTIRHQREPILKVSVWVIWCKISQL